MSARYEISGVVRVRRGPALDALLAGLRSYFRPGLVADRQRIARLSPTAHRAAFRFLSRQRIADLGGGIDAFGRRSVPRPATRRI